jgi:hypothetical protein
MPGLVKTGLKLIMGISAIVGAIWTGGFGFSQKVNSFFSHEREEVEKMVDKKILATEDKAMAVRRADLEGIHGRFELLAQQQGTIIQQNYQVIKLLKEVKSESTVKWIRASDDKVSRY